MEVRNSGFTLMEILVVVAILSFTIVIALAVSIPKIQSSKLDATLDDMSSVIFVAQQNAFAGRDDVSYGVYFNTDSYYLYTGDSYASAVGVEEVHFPVGTTISQISLNDSSSEVLFPRGTIIPSTYGTVSITNGTDVYYLEINQEGLIEWYTL